MNAWLPPDDARRVELHGELHARPAARLRLPALIVYVAVLNEGVSRAQELAHLQALPGQAGLGAADLAGNFLRLRFADHSLKWERHNEFSRYSLVQALPDGAGLGASEPALLAAPALPAAWLNAIPGRTLLALQLVLLERPAELDDAALLALSRQWFGQQALVAARLGHSGHSLALSDLRLREDGFERLLVLGAPGGDGLRAGRVAQRLLELETYRMMALLGLPVAKALAAPLADCEQALAHITAELQRGGRDGATAQLDALIALAARIEHATAAHSYRFAATAAYHGLVQQRLAELRESPLPGVQTLGGFMRRRLWPAVATVQSSATRLEALARRVERSSALLRTCVDIAAQDRQRELLDRLARGQALQLNLQTTVEGLSIAAISYYVVSLLAYALKSLKSLGLPLNPELTVGALIPPVLWLVWRAGRRVHARFHQPEGRSS